MPRRFRRSPAPPELASAMPRSAADTNERRWTRTRGEGYQPARKESISRVVVGHKIYARLVQVLAEPLIISKYEGLVFPDRPAQSRSAKSSKAIVRCRHDHHVQRRRREQAEENDNRHGGLNLASGFAHTQRNWHER